MKFDQLVDSFLKPKRGSSFAAISKKNKTISSKKDIAKNPKYQRKIWKKEEKQYY